MLIMKRDKRAKIKEKPDIETKKPDHLKVGVLGEEIACKFLVKQGFQVVGRNFRQKCGEIDIIAIKNHTKDSKNIKTLHFFEVKTVSRERKRVGDDEQTKKNSYRAEENIHFRKLERFSKTVQLYLLKFHVPHETPLQIDGITVVLDFSTRRAKVSVIENINV